MTRDEIINLGLRIRIEFDNQIFAEILTDIIYWTETTGFYQYRETTLLTKYKDELNSDDNLIKKIIQFIIVKDLALYNTKRIMYNGKWSTICYLKADTNRILNWVNGDNTIEWLNNKLNEYLK